MASYLIGSFPSAYLAGRLVGIDIRKAGSGNIGATNVARVLGKRFGYPVFVIDVAKGFVAVKLAEAFAGTAHSSAFFVDLCGVLGAMFAVLGHSFQFGLDSKAAKSCHINRCFVALNWIPALVVGIVWIVMFQTTRYVSLASIVAVISLPIAVA